MSDDDKSTERETRLLDALHRIGYITETNLEHSGQMAEAIDRIHDIAYAAVNKDD